MKFQISLAQESAERWHAWVPELPGCAARGRSQVEVAKKIDLAIRGYLASWDMPIPSELEEELIQVHPVGAATATLVN